MKALLLAAGLGERVHPLTEKIPKPMLPVVGRPLIHYPIAMLAAAGIAEVVINVHHLADVIRKGLRDGKSMGIEIVYAPEPVLLGTGGPLNGLRDYFASEAFVLANSDTILDLDLRAMIGFHRDRGAIATMLLSRADRQSLRERIEIDRDGRIRRMRLLKSRNPVAFDDYPRELEGVDGSSLSAFMYSGVLVLEPAILELIPEDCAVVADDGSYRAGDCARGPGVRFCARRLFSNRRRSRQLSCARARVRNFASTLPLSEVGRSRKAEPLKAGRVT